MGSALGAREPTRTVVRIFAWLVCAGGVGFWAACVVGRVLSPYPIEWMEGATLAHVRRLLAAQPLYAAPSAEFIAYLYPPLGYLPMALTTTVFGSSLPAARAANVLLFALSAWAVARAARSLAGERLAGPFAVGLWAFGYGYGGGFADVARVDATMLCLLAWGAERLTVRRMWSGVTLLALSVFAKQHGLVFLAAGSAWALLCVGARVRLPVAVAWLGVLAVGVTLQGASDGWFLTYTWTLPRSHGLAPALLFGYLGVYVALMLPLLAVCAGVALWRARRAPAAAHALLLAGLVASALGRAHPGGDDNVLLPGYLLLSIVAVGPLCQGLLRASPRRAAWLASALLVQLAMLFQAPWRYWPGSETARAVQALEAGLTRCAEGGSAVALDFAGLTNTAFVHTMALSDLRLGGPSELGQAGTDALLARLAGPNAPRALAVGTSFKALDVVLDRRYRLCAEFAPVPLPTGYQPPAQRVYTLLDDKGYRRK